MVKKPAKQTGVKQGQAEKPLAVKALKINQGQFEFYVFSMKASQLWPLISINRRSETEDTGYQRVLSNARVEAVANHIRSGQPVPNSVLIALDHGTYDVTKGQLSIPAGKDVGWVIDGQHRIAGAHEAADKNDPAKTDIELCVIAFVAVGLEFQIEQFVTINREAKGVPTSLVYDLLAHLPGRRKPGEIATERAAEIANVLRSETSSPFFSRIVVTTSPAKGQLSITNFVRKISPLVHPERGILRTYTLPEQLGILSNYFSALKDIYPEQWSKADNIFFRTIGFGAMLNIFEEIFQMTLSSHGGFTVLDVKNVLGGVRHFEFAQWASYGSGNKAEMEAAQDFRTDLNRARQMSSNTKGLRL